MRLTILLIVVACASVYGQTQKGSWMVGGSMNIQHQKTPAFSGSSGTIVNVPSTSFSVSPAIGYFVMANWAVGLSTSFAGTKSGDNPFNYDAGSFNFDAGPFTRYYFRFGKFAVFPEISARWGKERQRIQYNDGTAMIDYATTARTYNYRAGAGVAWFIANNVALEGILYYSQDMNRTSTLSTWKSTVFNVGLQFFIPAKTPG